jgi:serine/threonine-protein kinase
VELLRKAQELAPDDVGILSAHARAWARRWFFEGGSGDAAIRMAEQAAVTAPSDPDAQLALGTVRLVQGDVSEAAAASRRALELAPDSPDALEFAGRLLIEVDAPEIGVRMLERALQGEPDIPNARIEIVRGYALLGDWVAARRWFEEPAEQDPKAGAVAFRARVALWSPQMRFLIDGVQGPPEAPLLSPWGIVRVAQAIAAGGDAGEAVATLVAAGHAMTMPRRLEMLVAQMSAEFLTHCGRLEAAASEVERAVDAGLFDLTWMDRCPVLAPLRSLPRFAAARTIVAERARAVRDALGDVPDPTGRSG